MESTINLNGKEFTKEQIKNILSSRMVIEKPGKYQVKVSQVTEYTPEGGTPRFIVNLTATTKFHVGRAIEALKAEDYQAALNTNLTATVFVNDGVPSTYLPSKGETVNIIVSEMLNKQNEKILVVNSIMELPVVSANTAKGLFDSVFEGTDELKEIATEAKKLQKA